MRALLDENVPRALKALLPGHDVRTVQEMNWAGIQNGELVLRADAEFDVLLTADKNLRYQQNLANRRIAIVELPTNRWPMLKTRASEVLQAIDASQVASSRYVVVEFAS